jgi:pimeloyl-ACP methyl ester carboxylesterase/tellurite resistance protein
MTATSWWQDAFNYGVDSAQRSILFWDVMRKRGNSFFDHLRVGQPPVLTFDYEIIMDGRAFEQPVNYALARIIDRRAKERSPGINEAVVESKPAGKYAVPKRPIVVIDPRAGHGPGIGGSKRDSEIGVALDNGHPVYFILFFTQPEPGQTLAGVEYAETRFIEEVVLRHPDADRPALIGNCQGGWAAALICADRPDLTGHLVLNGAPLSYWAGIEGVNPMRYKGGLCGGVWLNTLLSDLGNGKFDGANLVLNFEDLNPANTLWTKQYNLYSQIDHEAERYLKFEKWWGGFFFMTAEEIRFIVENLFVGNKLEKGELELRSGRCVSLKNIDHPIVVFASWGDNITPPQQALGWIPRVYGSDSEIQERGHVIIYILHEKIGHLGIFVSGDIAKKEHTEIIGNFDLIDYLPAGLYEMIIDEEAGPLGKTDFEPRFEKRTIADMLAQVGGLERDDKGEDSGDFRRMADLSKINGALYQAFLQPWIRAWSTDVTAEIFKMLHPMRVQRWALSDLNPSLWPVSIMAPCVKENRKAVSEDNPFVQMEKILSAGMEETLNHFRNARDHQAEMRFKNFYNSEVIERILPKGDKEKVESDRSSCAPVDRRLAQKDIEAGGFAEAALRLIILVCSADGAIDRKEYSAAQKIVMGFKVLRRLDLATMKRMIRQQARIVQMDLNGAIKALPKMVKDRAERKTLYEIALKIAEASGGIVKAERLVLDKIKKVLVPAG